MIPVDTSSGEPLTDARALHTSLGAKRDFSNWFKQRVEECDLVENQDFGITAKFGENSGKGRPTTDYWLTLDAAKEMAMLERNEAGKRIRRYLIDVEKKFRALRMQPDLSDPRVLLRYLYDTSGKLIESQERVAALEDSNDLLKIGLKLESEGRQVAEQWAAEVKQTVVALAAKIDAPIKGVNLTTFAKDTAAVLGYSVHARVLRGGDQLDD